MNLTVEQRKKIEENKAAALLKKQQFIQKFNPTSLQHNHNSLQYNKKENTNSNINTNTNTNNNTNKIKFHLNKKNVETQIEPTTRATLTIISEDRFIVDMVYHSPSIEIFKTIPGRLYDSTTRKWSFPLTEHSTLVTKLRKLKPELIVNAIPDPVLKCILHQSEPENVDWSRIDKILRDNLLPFQVDGVRFGIGKKGKCLIADDMGLGKTIQALGIACYFKQNWPLLIVCPTSMRFPWFESIKSFLPNINPKVFMLLSGKDPIPCDDIIITSYDLMKNCSDRIFEKKFQVIIFDESHLLKNSKSARTKVALQLSQSASQIILLSGTPALSRPQELYSQIFALDPITFQNFYDFGLRYCDGKKDRFGWNFAGSSNLEELEVYLKKKIMIRRLKSDVMAQLPSKIRKVIIFQPNMIKKDLKQMQKMESDYASQKGAEKHNTFLTYYHMTGTAKLNAVCEYIEDKLENNNKFLVFAHHSNVLNGICETLEKKAVEYIKIDGSVNSEDRQLMCQRFQTAQTCRVAVLSLKAANCGITLTEAQLVIFAELFWNPGELTQAEDRAHRIGQRDSVVVEYLLAKGTADDHLWNLVQSKLNTLNKVGLSKDNFKESHTQLLKNDNQLTLTSMFSAQQADTIDSTNTNNHNEDKEVIKEFVEEDDAIFDSINLEEIENNYLTVNKKRKIINFDD